MKKIFEVHGDEENSIYEKLIKIRAHPVFSFFTSEQKIPLFKPAFSKYTLQSAKKDDLARNHLHVLYFGKNTWVFDPFSQHVLCRLARTMKKWIVS